MIAVLMRARTQLIRIVSQKGGVFMSSDPYGNSRKYLLNGSIMRLGVYP